MLHLHWKTLQEGDIERRPPDTSNDVRRTRSE